MRYAIVIPPSVLRSLRRFRAADRKVILDAIETYLRTEPERARGSRIKRLRGMEHPQFRLRVGDEFRIRILYSVASNTVEVRAALTKDEVGPWLDEEGEPE